MTSVDDLFKASGSSQKRRKIDHDPSQFYTSPAAATNGHKATVEDEEDAAAGPERPPDADDNEEAEADDEEGRFFGGGVEKSTKDAMNFLDERDVDGAYHEEKFDTAWLRKTALNFEKRISKNAELRARYDSEPQKFMSSEADLDADIKALSILSEHPNLYKDFADLGCISSLVSLLAHENTDISIDVIEILGELTAEDVDAVDDDWQALLGALANSDLPDLLIQNMERLDENNDADRMGIYHCLTLIENLASDAATVEKLISESSSEAQNGTPEPTPPSPLLKWLLNRIQKKESPTSQNKQYSAEILAILTQSSPVIQTLVASLEGIDVVLQLLSAYRKRDPQKDSEEEEYAENLFDSLICLVGDTRRTAQTPGKTSRELDIAGDTTSRKHKFVEAEGIELCLIMIREGKYSKPRALKVLDHAMGGAYSSEVCEKFVESAGLKTIFGIFMKEHDHTTTEHLIGIFASLLRLLPENSPGRLRVLAKFMEKDYEKVRKLVKLREGYAKTYLPVEKSIKEEQMGLSEIEREDLAESWLSRRLDAGLYCFQAIALVLAWLCAEDAGAKTVISKLQNLAELQQVLREQLNDLGLDQTEEEQSSVREEVLMTSDMLQTLIDCLG